MLYFISKILVSLITLPVDCLSEFLHVLLAFLTFNGLFLEIESFKLTKMVWEDREE